MLKLPAVDAVSKEEGSCRLTVTFLRSTINGIAMNRDCDARPPAPALPAILTTLPALLALLALLALAACDAPPSGPAVVTATIRADSELVAGAIAELRLLNDSAVVATTNSAGRVRLELAGARRAGIFEVARDTAELRPQRVYAPLLIAPGDSADLTVDLDGDDDDPGGQGNESGADPGRYPRVRYRTDGRMARWGRAVQAIDAIEVRHYEAYQDWVAAGQPGELAVDFGGTVDSVRAALETERDPEVRAALWVALLTAVARRDSMTVEQADRALREIDPGAAVWEWRPWSLASLVRMAAAKAEGVPPGPASADGQEAAGRRALADRRTAAYLDRVIEAHADTVVRPSVLLAAMRLADATGRSDDAVAYYERLLDTHPESQAAQVARKETPGTRLHAGDPVPDVALPALDSTAPPITPAELAGPATLVDFWAAWCTPCVAEMPVIHDAYERFADRGFDVVSVSFDAYRDDVHRFRERYPMPWRHAFVGAGALSEGEVAAAWGVHGLPSAYLVGPDGRILALEDELRGERLAETLERVLGD